HARRNYLMLAVEDWDILAKDPLPADRLDRLLDTCFDINSVFDKDDEGIDVYAWMVRSSLMRPDAIPNGRLSKYLQGFPADALDAYAVLRARRESIPDG